MCRELRHPPRCCGTIGPARRASWRNAIERAVLPGTADVLQLNSLPPQLSPIVASRRVPTAPAAILPPAEVERQVLVHALEVRANNVTRAVRSLGLNCATLYRKLQRYCLSVGN